MGIGEHYMRVLYKWEKCEAFRWANEEDSDDLCTAYYVELKKEEIDEKLYDLFIKNSFVDPKELRKSEYFDYVNDYEKRNPKLVNKDCAYILVDENITKIILCNCYYPYASLWNAYCPFEKLYREKLRTVEDHKNYGIIIRKLTELKNIDMLIEAKLTAHNKR